MAGLCAGCFGNSIAQTCLTPYFTHGMAPEEVPAAQGMFQFSSTGGATIFVAFVGVLVNITGSIKPVFYSGAVLAVINFVMVLMFLRIKESDAA